MISIIIPYYKTDKSEFYLARCLKSIREQTFQDYEIVISEGGSASYNVNKGVKEAQGDIIKVLCMDDYFTNNNSLKEIHKAFKGDWLIHGVSNHKTPHYTGDIHLGNNRLGGLSSMVFKKDSYIPLDETLVWLLDCDWHKQMYMQYGLPVLLTGDYVTIQEGEGQATNLISKEIKKKEVLKLQQKYA